MKITRRQLKSLISEVISEKKVEKTAGFLGLPSVPEEDRSALKNTRNMIKNILGEFKMQDHLDVAFGSSVGDPDVENIQIVIGIKKRKRKGPEGKNRSPAKSFTPGSATGDGKRYLDILNRGGKKFKLVANGRWITLL